MRDYVAESGRLLLEHQGPEALALCEEGLAQGGPASLLWNNKGIALVYLGQFQEALDAFETALKLDPTDGDASYNRSIAIRSMERHEEAMENYAVTYRNFPDHFENAMNFGNVSRRLGRYEQAYEAYTHGLSTRPDSDELYYNRGALLILMEKYPEAETDLDQALALNPEYGEAWYCKAICRDRLGDAPGSRAAYAMAIKYQPPCLNPHFSWGEHPENLEEPHGPAMRGEVIKGV